MPPYFVDPNIKALVVACNTATAVATDPAAHRVPQPADHRRDGNAKHFGQRAVPGAAGSARWQPCDGLADAIERGSSLEHATKIIAAYARHTGAMGMFGTQPGHIDTLVPAARVTPSSANILQALVGVDVTLVENGEAVARQTQRMLHTAKGTTGAAVTGQGGISLLTTGDAHTLKAAAVHWLGLHEPGNPLQI